jgi:hypothetical protein
MLGDFVFAKLSRLTKRGARTALTTAPRLSTKAKQSLDDP